MMTIATEKCICVWYDSYSSADDHAWIVSLDDLDDRGRAETTRTLYSSEDEDAVIERARVEGERRGLPVYRNEEGQPRELLFAAPESD